MKALLLTLTLPLTLLLAPSCKKNPTPITSNTDQTQSPQPPDTTPIVLCYPVTYAQIVELTIVPTVEENDPFAGLAPKKIHKLLARAGLPLPKGSSFTHTGSFLFITAPAHYHEEVSSLLGVHGTAQTHHHLTEEAPINPSPSK